MDDNPRLTSNGPLDYAPAPRWRRRRRPWQRGIGILFLLAIGFAIWHLGPAAWNTVRMLYWQRQALTYTASPDQVVYEEEPQLAKTLLAGSGGYAPFTPGYSVTAAAVLVPSCVPKLSGVILPASPITGATLFLHEMKTPDGRPHLVVVQYHPSTRLGLVPHFIEGLNYSIEIVQPAALRRAAERITYPIAPKVLSVHQVWKPNLRVYAGQIDPADASHFTIRYEMWGQSDVLDGRLDNTPQVTLTPRNPPKRPGRGDFQPPRRDVYQVIARHG